MQKNDPDITEVTPDAPVRESAHGGRAKCLQRLVRLGLPVPRSVALSFETVRRIAEGAAPDPGRILAPFGPGPVLCVRPSSGDPDWGGLRAYLSVGLNAERHEELSGRIGRRAASGHYLRLVQSYGEHVMRFDPEAFEDLPDDPAEALGPALDVFEREAGEGFPQDPGVQLQGVLQFMARAWQGTSARLLRQARGAPEDAGLGLVVQEMAGLRGGGECGTGVLQLASGQTGRRGVEGHYNRHPPDSESPAAEGVPLAISSAAGGDSLEERAAQAHAELLGHAELMRSRLREEMRVEFAVDGGCVWILDGVPALRTARAAVAFAVALAEEGIVDRDEALMRVEPRALTELLHRHVDPEFPREVLARGVAASPGAASGRIVFSGAEALAREARGEACILVTRETSLEDIRGMHAADGVLTGRGGTTSHAAVIARGIGKPCVVGVGEMEIDAAAETLCFGDETVLRAGDRIAIDGGAGEVLSGETPLTEPAWDAALSTLLEWAGEPRDLVVRANVDTPSDAKVARSFGAAGIGLCRTEHMFFDSDRLTPMREMIFADSGEERRAALQRLLPMQRQDFADIFRIMDGLPVCIRLFDPPLHEFLPFGTEGMRDLAVALELPLSDVSRRVEELREFNPMLGMRGVRLGIAVPEIYEMQARAIFEAAVEAGGEGCAVAPEIMIPLVSARREVELVKSRVDAVAAAVAEDSGHGFEYRLGVMVETPRAALRAGDIALQSSFLSFGTNDLTQMTYGLSRDDAGRFMSEYVRQGVYAEDPFRTLDTQGVGELLTMAAERGRNANPELVLSICGEHGGDPETIAFCREAQFDYVSCSPFRVPLARLAVAQLAIRSRRGDPQPAPDDSAAA